MDEIVKEYYKYLLQRFKDTYDYEIPNDPIHKDDAIFTRKNGMKFILSVITLIPEGPVLLIEHQCDPGDVRTQYCDGDLFHLSDMSKEEMYEAMLKEIENGLN